MELVEAELKTRQSLPEPAGDSGTEQATVPTRGAKRRRLYTPVESCPFCQHTYTVRDGLAQHTGPNGHRWLLVSVSLPVGACEPLGPSIVCLCLAAAIACYKGPNGRR